MAIISPALPSQKNDKTFSSQPSHEASATSSAYTPTANQGEQSGNFSEEALEANKFMIGNSIFANSKAIATESDNTAAGIGKPALFASLYNRYANTLLKTVPKENRGYAQAMLAYNGQKAFNVLNSNAMKENNKSATQQFNQTFANNLEEMRSAARANDMTAALTFHGQITQMVDSGLKANWITSSQAKYYQDESTQNLNQERVLGQFQLALNQGDEDKFQKGFKKSKQKVI